MSDDLFERMTAAIQREVPDDDAGDLFGAAGACDVAIRLIDLAREEWRTADRSSSGTHQMATAVAAAEIAVVALYLAFSSVKARRDHRGDPDARLPADLDALVTTTMHLRDTVMHRSDKISRTITAVVLVMTDDVIAVQAPGKPWQGDHDVIARATWTEMGTAAAACRSWALTSARRLVAGKPGTPEPDV